MEPNDIDKIDAEITNKNAVEDRVRNAISAKKEAEAKFEASEKARLESDAKIAQMQKDTSFLNSFSDINTKFPAASEFKDKIKEKVMTSGYSVEDATVAVLHAEGKYQAPQVKMENVTGGSAPNQITNPVIKTTQQMSSSERWEALREAERRGDLGLQ